MDQSQSRYVPIDCFLQKMDLQTREQVRILHTQNAISVVLKIRVRRGY